jgi:hypothetical protein
VESANLERGDVLIAGRYRLHEQLDRTDRSSLWRATDELHGQVVAVRRIPLFGLPAAEAASLRDRILRAARAVGTHPNLVAVFDSVVEAGELWVVQEYLPAPTLAAVLADRGPLPAGEVAAIGSQVASALAAVHAAGAVHGGVGPATVVLAWPAAKLDGFGTAPQGADRGGDVHALGALLDRAIDRRGAGPLMWPLMSLMAADPRARPTAAQAESVLRDVAAALAKPAGGRSGRRWVAFGLVSGLLAAAVVAGAIAIAIAPGGSSSPVTAPVTATAPAAGSAPATLSIGNPRTADPCSLIDEPALRRHGTTDVAPYTGVFTSCWAFVAVRPQTEVALSVELTSAAFSPEQSGGVREQRGPVTLVRYTFDGAYCARRVHLPDSGVVRVVADSSAGVDGSTICAVADTGANAVVERLLEAGVTERPTPMGSTVLAGQDACRLLTAGDLGSVAGVVPTPVPGMANWSCRWGIWEGPNVIVSFTRRDDDPMTGETPIDIGGRSSLLYRGSTADECAVTFPQQRIVPRIEAVWVSVYDPRAGADTCGAATAIATAVAAKLPPPS